MAWCGQVVDDLFDQRCQPENMPGDFFEVCNLNETSYSFAITSLLFPQRKIMSKAPLKTRKVTTHDTVKALREKGIDVSEKDAEIILDFLYFLAKLTVNQYINNNCSDSK